MRTVKLKEDFEDHRREKDGASVGRSIWWRESVVAWGFPTRKTDFLDEDSHVAKERKIPGYKSEVRPPVS